MRLSDLKSGSDGYLSHISAIATTPQFRRRLDSALDIASQFLKACERPVISCGGGKDGTATAIIIRAVDKSIPILCAHPPNPLPDRAGHIERLKDFLGGIWIDVEYWWDVDAVLKGEIAYPHMLKLKRLKEKAEELGIDGVAMGVRMAESKGRRINGRVNGEMYRIDDGWRCLPVLRWSAEETLALSLQCGAPINPVYTKLALGTNLEHIRDGTWWPHGYSDSQGFGQWIKTYYPECHHKYEQASRLMDNSMDICLL